jgi:penicillin-binding protein 1C
MTLWATVLLAVTLGIATAFSLKPMDRSLRDITSSAQAVRITDRNGQPLSITYQSRWNNFDHVSLYEVPGLMKTAFILSEDRRFYEHHGVDWQARLSALWQNIRNRRAVRGASTISEQAVRMINERPRTIWSRWLEGFEAMALERSASKADILEFYLNQIPYAANRRGIVQAARYYFNRDLSTLTPKEMLALAILVRAPSGYDLYRNPGRIDAPVMRLAAALKDAGALSEQDFMRIAQDRLQLEQPVLPVDARHFARYVRLAFPARQESIYRTTLDARLQGQVQNIMDNRLKALAGRSAHNAAALVADHQTGEILAWVVSGTKASEFDAVTTPRQPGSALKPFLYARALDKGWTAATILDDSPLAEAVGSGLHRFRNYSNIHYGPVTLREALGNSLNIPALLAIRHVGTGEYLTTLQKLGFESLVLNSEIYDEGLALGNGEVTLLEMGQAYAALANKGVYRPLRLLQQQDAAFAPVRVYSEEAASLIGNILSDPWARRLEFGAGSVLNLPVQTAAKTGTSNDYRDAWAMGYNDRYVVSIWMGNLDNTPMKDVTGSTGPALALRGIFSLLNKNRETSRLYFSPRLSARDICIRPPDKDGSCPVRTEWFAPGTEPEEKFAALPSASSIELIRPTDGLQIAYDPRIPREHQKFRFEVRGTGEGDWIEWVLDGQLFRRGMESSVLWPVEKGKHVLSVSIKQADAKIQDIAPVHFIVK